MLKKTVSALLIGGALLMCQSAVATDYCVAPATCANQEATLEDALVAAGGSTNADRIFLGADTYTAPTTAGYSYTAANSPVELIGVGQGQTVVTAPSAATGVLVLTGSPANSLHDLTVTIPESVPINTTGLRTDGTARRISVTDVQTQVQGHHGVDLTNGATLEDSTVALRQDHGTLGVTFGKGGATLRNTSVTALYALDSYYGGTIEHARLAGSARGLFACGGTTTIRNSLITTTANADAIDAEALFIGSNVTVDADGLTLVGADSLSANGVFAFTNLAANVDVSLRDSVIRGLGVPLQAQGNMNGAAAITASYSDYDSSKNQTGIPVSTITESHITNVGDAGFVNRSAGDFRLAPSSPLIDAGDPMAQPGTDLDGNKLIVDGNGDGTARRDIGAFEFQPLPPAPAPVVEPAPEPVAPPVVAADTQAPLISAFSSSNRAFAVDRARTAVSAVARGTKLRYTLSEAAKVTITIKRIGAKRSAGRLTRTGKVGANVIRFSGRIGKRALRAGRYRAVITAVDAAGNRSAPRTASFRVVP